MLILTLFAVIPTLADTKPSPRRAVHVRSPMRYQNGILQAPDNSPPGTSHNKLASSFDVIEGSPTRRNVYNHTHTQMKPKSNRQLVTDNNFFPGSEGMPDPADPVTKQNTAKNSKSQFPRLMQQLMDQTQGSFQRDGADRYINDFFQQDVTSSPRFR